MEVKINPGMVCLQLGLWAMMGGCLPARHSPAALPSLPSSRDTPSGPLHTAPSSTVAPNEIIFLSLAISQSQAGTSRVIRMENLIKKQGILKNRSPKAIPEGPYLQCTLLAGTQVLDTLRLEHPLFRNAEVLNAQNQVVRLPVTLQQADFFIRFQQNGADMLVITERMPASPLQELIRIKL